MRRSIREVEGAGAVGADLPVPTVTVAGGPGVDFGGEPADTGNEKNPTEVFPTGEKRADAGPGFYAAGDAPARVNGLHPAHGEFAIDLREALLGGGIVKVEEFDAVVRVEAADGSNAGAAEAAGAVVEDEEVRRGLRVRGHRYV